MPIRFLLQGRVITPLRELVVATVLVEGQHIAWVKRGKVDVPGSTLLTEVGDTVTPGFIDLQVNGLAGHDAASGADAIAAISSGLPRYGVTSFLPTLISRPIDEAVAFVSACAAATASGARVIGAHVEGPFLNPKYRGAHDPKCLLLPTRAHVQGLLTRPPRMVTLAPELPGALEAVGTLTAAGVTVSAGHSGASFAEAEAGFVAGVRFGTHLFNAMVPLHHREPGLPGALLAEQLVTVGLIADGIHVHPAMLALAVRMAGPGRVALTSDSTAAAGAPAGRYAIAGRETFSDGISVRLADGTLAGSAVTMNRMVQLMSSLPGLTLRDAVEMATLTPARVLGIEGECGVIRRDARADLVVLDPEQRVRLTLIGGQVVDRRGGLDA
ncbi:MAG TPA: N-acetylglucosamine-6-phosphate deacetylase [Candidatus Dormibacteraeota bacterium]|nr:N-acetylglucosamine-6-phosphate deacetylase [Candidatus Dormibacteraeota bacterium]